MQTVPAQVRASQQDQGRNFRGESRGNERSLMTDDRIPPVDDHIAEKCAGLVRIRSINLERSHIQIVRCTYQAACGAYDGVWGALVSENFPYCIYSCLRVIFQDLLVDWPWMTHP